MRVAVGAANLGRACGLPRRICAEIKSRELSELELERKARCATVVIAAPNIVRGFDAMHVDSLDGKAYWQVVALLGSGLYLLPFFVGRVIAKRAGVRSRGPTSIRM